MKLTRPGLVVCSSLILAAGCGSEASPERPRNVILISIDTLRPDHMGCYGHDRDTSPAMDRLAEEGALFEDVTSGSPWTLPGHATILTGMYPSTHTVKDHTLPLPKGIDTLATRFKRADYQTWALVNSHNIGTKEYGLVRGFEPQRTLYLPEMDPPTGGPIVNRGREITDTALRWLGERGAKPFFFFLHYYDVHTDFTPEPEYRERFVSEYNGKLTGSTGQLVAYRKRRQPLTDADVRFLKEMYDAEIRQLDDILAGLFDYLDESGLSDDTLVVITSDHGEEYFEHGGVLHGRTQYQELLAIPLILRGPGVPAGLRIDTPVHQADIAPTIVSLLGLEPLQNIDGIDLSHFWRNPGALPELRFLYGEADHNNQIDGQDVIDIKKMVRLEYDKLLYDTHTKLYELYDLEKDPGELKDLQDVDPQVLEVLKAELERYMANAQTGKPIPPPDAATLKKLEALGYAGED